MDPRLIEAFERDWVQKFISEQEYNHWRQNYLFDALKSMRMGESFCQEFGIKDYILIYALDPAKADNYIREHYVRPAPNIAE
jgi:hypothetical protein